MCATMPLLFICGGATFCLFATPEAVFGDSACAAVAGAVVPQPNAPAVKSEKTASEQRPKCQLKLLSAEVRVKREKGHRSLLEKDPGYRVPRRVPTEVEATNPIVFRDYFAVVIFENSTRPPLELYGLRKRGNEDAADPRSAFILEIEIRDATNRVVKAKPTGLISIAPPRFPSAKELSSQEHHTVIAFQPKQKLEIECSILGNLLLDDLTHGKYSIRASLSYAAAPSVEKQTIQSAPLVLTITKDQILQAKAFYLGKHNKKK